MLRINIRSKKGTATLVCSGRIVFGLEAETLRSIAKARHEPYLQLDLAAVETIDASGLGLLVELQHWAAHEKRSLRITNPSEFVERLLVATRLHLVLKIPVRQPWEHEGERCRLASAALSA